MSASSNFVFKERIGIVLIVEAGTLSAIAVTILLTYIAWEAFKTRKSGSHEAEATRPVHLLFVNLMISDLVQAMGGILSAKWAAEARVIDGPLCIAQGALKQIGDVGVALTSLALAVHTFCVLVFRVRAPKWWTLSSTATSLVTIAAIWIFITMMVSIGAGSKGASNYYVNTGYWCWIHQDFLDQRIALEYLWLWFSCFANIIIYGFIFLVFRGTIIVGDDNRIHLGKGNTSSDHFGTSKRDKENRTLALQMLFYPAVYTITVFPISILRWLQFSTSIKPPFEATIFAGILFALSGVLNVTLFTLTRPSVVRPHSNPVVVSHGPQAESVYKRSPGNGRLPDLEEVDSRPSLPETRGILPEVYSMGHVSNPSEATGKLSDNDDADSDDDYRGSRNRRGRH